MARYEHSGSAQDAHLVGTLSATGLGLSIDSYGGWPTGGTNKFWIAIDPDTALEEHILVNTRSAGSLTIAAIGDRGKEGTTAAQHAAGAVVRHIFSATEADDMALQSVTNTFAALQNILLAAPGVALNARAAGSGTGAGLNVGVSGSNNVTLAAGAEFDGTTSTARSTAASQIEQTAGAVNWYSDTGLTVGSTYTRTKRMALASGGGLSVLGDDHYFGANALGGTGTRVHLGSLGDPNNAFVVGDGSPTNVGLILRPKGGGTVQLQNSAAQAVVEVGYSGGNRYLGFYGVAPVLKPTVTGSRGANAALTSLMNALDALGIVTDSTT